MGELVARLAELELHAVQLQSHVELSLRDKKLAESDLDQMREKLRATLQEKIELENNFNLIQKHEMKRLNDLELKFEDISQQYIRCKEENQQLLNAEDNLNNDFRESEKARLSYKEQYLEMRQLNKDLKLHFTQLEKRVTKF